MLPKDLDELSRVRHDCYVAVTQRAGISSGAAIVPIPGLDVITDVGVLLELLPEINRRFGLSVDQISQYDPKIKTAIASLAIKVGSEIVGRVITKEIIMAILKRIGIRVTAKQVLKFIPFLGSAAAAAISFGAMKLIGDQHVNQCYDIAKRLLEEGGTGGQTAS